MKTIFISLLIVRFSLSTFAQSDIEPFPGFIDDMELMNSPIVTQLNDTVSLFIFKGNYYDLNTIKKSRIYKYKLSGLGESVAKLNILIENKKTNEYKLLDLISRLWEHSLFLAGKSFKFNEGQPNQHKIAYSWGQKNYLIREKSPGIGCYCKELIHGLDCSGFIYQIFTREAVVLPINQCNAETERNPSFLKKYLALKFNSNSVVVSDKGALKTEFIKSGDIIYFTDSAKRAFHIGILFKNEKGQVFLFQSLGRPNRYSSSSDICIKNLDDDHGVISKVIDNNFLSKYKFSYGVVRIENL